MSKKIEDIRNGDTKNTKTIFHGLLNSDLPEDEKSNARLTREGRIVMEGGTTTSALAISSICFHLLSNPDKLRILKEELASVIHDPDTLPTMAQVETLPYLVSLLIPLDDNVLILAQSAVIQEGLRLNPPSTLRMERIARDGDLFYKDPSGKEYIIPAGVSPSASES